MIFWFVFGVYNLYSNRGLVDGAISFLILYKGHKIAFT